ncbi:CTD kinase subunit gamma CTK3-domain-containing protein [Epithele typhae]|uniref:CTD kinase subunit gamma CTK3-domain-containing protein n=1 Tax=Epithele typhae TaxID=378194 RepID=UPI002007D63A|nr:CTD kinase subunit gamma CTK3-domain-containing protein [Epithele typhae]KAH9925850.1 CTD kinase subunit gamma CTK3-domain-containing protein [Epithele typhae]
MDPFEVRMQFLTLLRRLDASQTSIKKIVGYALKYFPSCGEDLWDCIMEECQKGSLNVRINILYLLDTLCETCLLALSRPPLPPVPGQLPASTSTSSTHTPSYVDYVARDLRTLADYVVPPGAQGTPNYLSAVKVLESWRTKRVVPAPALDAVLATFEERRADALAAAAAAASAASVDGTPIPNAPGSALALDPHEIKRRMEEDRERHKRLRERRWVQVVGAPTAASAPLASFLPLPPDDASPEDKEKEKEGAGALDVEFDNEWEATSDWNEDDIEAVAEENDLCFPRISRGGGGWYEGHGEEMDIS